MSAAASPHVEWRRPDIAIVDNALKPDGIGYLGKVASHATFDTQPLGRAVLRERDRSVVDDPMIAELLWRVLAPLMPPVPAWFSSPGHPTLDPPADRWRATCCNLRSRIYKYELGASFPPHTDEPWRPDETTRSIATVLVYLPAGGCEGGETVIDGEVVPVVDGRIVLFEQSLQHEGRPVERGTKIVLRNDIVATIGGFDEFGPVATRPR
jgi:prolyl 4-hydroxylase